MTWNYHFTEQNWNRSLWRSFSEKESIKAQALRLAEIVALHSRLQTYFGGGGIIWKIWKATDTSLENSKGQHFCPFDIILGLFLCTFVYWDYSFAHLSHFSHKV